ncbi:hypothetical protein BCR42DRAFT_405645 [Absidia repens]|uniref:RING-type domain-containing protein n=1 Tax=Absidia repens TaxID=90262 RepID=A0A1X2ITQ5_9FUNG|nr:hypothetical protein BCR42DRAFT_405645 [Absidia repens]
MNPETSEKISQCKQIREGLCCMICVEYFDNPHTLECGHSYCQGCLHQWLNNNKSCPECRLPVSRRPCPSYVLQKIVDAFKPLVGLTVTQISSNGHSSSASFWDKLFPNHDPHGYFWDESDDVARCASCMNELEPDGQCEHCRLQYELGNEENGIRHNHIDLDMDIDMAHEDEDEYNDSDIDFVVNDDQVEYDSDHDHDIIESSDDSDSDNSGIGLPGYYEHDDSDDDSDDGSDEGLSDTAAHDIHNLYDDEDDDIQYSDDERYGDSEISFNNILQRGEPRTIEILDSDNDEDTSSSEDDDDNTADYAGLADFQDEYGTTNLSGGANGGVSRNKQENEPSSSTSTLKQPTASATAAKSTIPSLSESSDTDGDSSGIMMESREGKNKKRRVIIDTDDEDDYETPVHAVKNSISDSVDSEQPSQKTSTKNKNKGKSIKDDDRNPASSMDTKVTGKRKTKIKAKNTDNHKDSKAAKTTTEGGQQIKKNHKKKKAKKNKKRRSLD